MFIYSTYIVHQHLDIDSFMLLTFPSQNTQSNWSIISSRTSICSIYLQHSPTFERFRQEIDVVNLGRKLTFFFSKEKPSLRSTCQQVVADVSDLLKRGPCFLSLRSYLQQSAQTSASYFLGFFFLGFFVRLFFAKYLDSWDVSVFKIRGCRSWRWIVEN